MWFLFGALLGYTIATSEAPAQCPKLSELGCSEQQACTWQQDRCEARNTTTKEKTRETDR